MTALWQLAPVMEQVSPKFILTSSKADLEFTEVCRDYGTRGFLRAPAAINEIHS